MNRLKKYIIISILIIFILIGIIIMSIIFHQNKDSNLKESNIVNNVNKTDELNIVEVKDVSEYATVERLVNVYNSAINQLNANLDALMVRQQDSESREKAKKQYYEAGKKILEDILEKEYQLGSKWEDELIKYSNNKFYIKGMKKIQKNNSNIYFIELTYDNDKNTDIIIVDDIQNNTYAIIPEEHLSNKKISKNDFSNILKEINNTSIEKNNNNVITIFNLSDEQKCLKYYYDYLNMLRNDNSKLYSTLNKEYREKRFENEEDFKNYITSNKMELEKAVLSKYQVKDRKDYIEYICVDENGRYYIFNSTAAMKYTMYLDSYTTDLPDFLERYNKSNTQEKMVLNIEKIISAINNKDYKYVYNKLANSFKENNFSNEESLKNYLQENFYEKNEVEYEDFKREGNIYTYKIRILRKLLPGEEVPEGKNPPSKRVNIIMQLDEETTNFIMSFSLEE